MTLPVSCLLAVIAWLVLPHGDMTSLAKALLVAASCVYMVAELNNRHALLRISSRTISSTLALLCALAVGTHRFYATLLVMPTVLLTFFPLFQSYQRPSPVLSFLVFLLLSVATFIEPHMVVFVPLYWLLQIYLRAFSLRSMVASLLALLTPYWIYTGVHFGPDIAARLAARMSPLATWHFFDYSRLAVADIQITVFAVLLFAIGAIDFLRNSRLDKTHTRFLFRAVITHGLYIIIYIVLCPQFVGTLLPLLFISSSILFGHFFALTYTRLSHIMCLVVALMAIYILFANI